MLEWHCFNFISCQILQTNILVMVDIQQENVGFTMRSCEFRQIEISLTPRDVNSCIPSSLMEFPSRAMACCENQNHIAKFKYF